MKVLLQGRFGLFSASGGDRVQVENTARELQNLGVEVILADNFVDNLESFDLIHVFQLDWTPETYFYIKKAKQAGKKIVLSPIHHNVSEVKKFDEKYVFDYRRVAKLLFRDQHARDTFKNIYRCIFSPKKIPMTLYSVVKGLKKMHIESLKLVDKVIVQTNLEAGDLINTYKVDIDWVKISNGVSKNFYDVSKTGNPMDFIDYILCVGRIEPRKNQLKIIKAVEKLRFDLKKDIKLVLIGRKNLPHHFEYTLKFNKYLFKHPWIHYIQSVPYDKIPGYFKFAKVCVSASFFETTGLTLLEALFCGTNAVASSPRAKEILGKYADYCDPYDVDSIYNGLRNQYPATRPVLDEDMKREYTWENCAKKTYQIYKEVCSK